MSMYCCHYAWKLIIWPKILGHTSWLCLSFMFVVVWLVEVVMKCFIIYIHISWLHIWKETKDKTENESIFYRKFRVSCQWVIYSVLIFCFCLTFWTSSTLFNLCVFKLNGNLKLLTNALKINSRSDKVLTLYPIKRFLKFGPSSGLWS